jgi:hypothetical protein
VRQRIQNLGGHGLSAGRNPIDAWDADTQFHKQHISDATSGKWKSVFQDDSQANLETTFKGYVALMTSWQSTPRGVVTERILGAKDGFIVVATSDFFAPVDSVVDFTRRLTAREATGGLGTKILDHVYLPIGRWDIELQVATDAAQPVLFACQDGGICFKSSGTPRMQFAHVNRLSNRAMDFHIQFDLGATQHDQSPPFATMVATPSY